MGVHGSEITLNAMMCLLAVIFCCFVLPKALFTMILLKGFKSSWLSDLLFMCLLIAQISFSLTSAHLKNFQSCARIAYKAPVFLLDSQKAIISLFWGIVKQNEKVYGSGLCDHTFFPGSKPVSHSLRSLHPELYMVLV